MVKKKYISYFRERELQQEGEYLRGRISNALSKNISYERAPQFFDEAEIRERDKELIELSDLKETDAMLSIDRRNKPVYLTPMQTRIIYALSFGISQEMGEEDVKEKIQNPRKGGNQITRIFNVTALSSFIFGSARAKYKEQIIREIYRISKVKQVQTFESGDHKIRITCPLINIGFTIEDLSKDKVDNLDLIEITFGSIFFFELDKRFSYITPKLFEVWRRNGRGTELFSALLNSILSVYWFHKNAAEKAEENVRKENKGLPKAELDEMIAERRKRAMSYELNVTRIKERVTIDYESKRSYKARFWEELRNAIEGFKELGLIDEAIIQKGAKDQEKVIFVLSERYSFAIKEDETAIRLLSAPTDSEDTISPY